MKVFFILTIALGSTIMLGTSAEAEKIKIGSPADQVLASREYADVVNRIDRICKNTIFVSSVDTQNGAGGVKVVVEFTTFAKYNSPPVASLEIELASEVTDVPLSIRKVNLRPTPGSCLTQK